MVLELVLPGFACLAGLKPVQLELNQLCQSEFRGNAVVNLKKLNVHRIRLKVFRQGLHPGTCVNSCGSLPRYSLPGKGRMFLFDRCRIFKLPGGCAGVELTDITLSSILFGHEFNNTCLPGSGLPAIEIKHGSGEP